MRQVEVRTYLTFALKSLSLNEAIIVGVGPDPDTELMQRPSESHRRSMERNLADLRAFRTANQCPCVGQRHRKTFRSRFDHQGNRRTWRAQLVPALAEVPAALGFDLVEDARRAIVSCAASGMPRNFGDRFFEQSDHVVLSVYVSGIPLPPSGDHLSGCAALSPRPRFPWPVRRTPSAPAPPP